MTEQKIDHYAEALGLVDGVSSLFDSNTDKFGMMDAALLDLGEAQVKATLALVDAQREANEQARIANLIALGQFRVRPDDLPHLRHLVVQPAGPNDIEPTDEIKKGLGL